VGFTDIPTMKPALAQQDVDARSLFRRAWLFTFIPFFAIGAVWVMSQPVYSGADEGQHAIESEAVWSGQFLPPLNAHFPSQIEAGIVHVPDLLSTGEDCFFNQKAVSARCDAVTLRGRPPTKAVDSYLSREPPLPSLLTGWPLFLVPDRTGFYLSRLLTAAIGAMLFATAVALAASRRRLILLLGVALAATPSVVAEWGVLGSSQLEIGSALVLWVCVALVASGERASVGLNIGLFGSFCVLVLSRPISFLYAGLAALVLIATAGREAIRGILSIRWAPTMASVALVVFAGSLVWFFGVEAPTNPNYLRLAHLPAISGVSQRISFSLGYQPVFWSQMIGATGNNEYYGPGLLSILWTMLAGAMVSGAVLLARRRQAVVVCALVTVLVLTPIAAQSYYLPTIYLTWMGRYDLPTFVGVVIVAAGLITPRGGLAFQPRLTNVVLLVVACLQALELASTMRRYVVGTNGPLDPFSWGNGWHPILAAPSLLGLGLVVIAAGYLALAKVARGSLVDPSAVDVAVTS